MNFQELDAQIESKLQEWKARLTITEMTTIEKIHLRSNTNSEMIAMIMAYLNSENVEKKKARLEAITEAFNCDGIAEEPTPPPIEVRVEGIDYTGMGRTVLVCMIAVCFGTGLFFLCAWIAKMIWNS